MEKASPKKKKEKEKKKNPCIDKDSAFAAIGGWWVRRQGRGEARRDELAKGREENGWTQPRSASVVLGEAVVI